MAESYKNFNMAVINKEQALKEVEGWLDFKKVRGKKRELYKESIKSLAEGISEGYLVLGTDMVFNLQLQFPIGKDGAVKELNFKPRVDVATLQDNKQGNKPGDGDAIILSIIAALTGEPRSVLAKMDSEDYDICGSIAVFFL